MANVLIPKDSFGSENKPSNPTAKGILLKNIARTWDKSVTDCKYIHTNTYFADCFNSLRKELV